MSAWLSGWRAALRIARREAGQAKARAALVIAMIALPVAGLAFTAVSYDTFALTAGEQADRLMGAAQAVATWPSDGPVRQLPDALDAVPTDPKATTPGGGGPPAAPTVERLLGLLPSGSRAIADLRGHLTVRTTGGKATLDARMLDYTDPLARGILRPRSGRAPAAADEIALTPAASRRAGAGVGGTVRLADGSRTFQVVGVVEEPSNLAATTIVLPAGALAAQALGADTKLTWLVATPGPLTWAQVKQLKTHGVAAVSRHVLTYPPSLTEQYAEYDSIRFASGPPIGIGVLVAGLALLEVVLLAGPAFAVSARRRRRDLALVAAAGASPAQLRRIVLADGVVLGAVAAATGIALGIAVAVAIRPWLEEHLANERSGGVRMFPTALAAVAGLAVVTGVLAALVPAWISSRQDVVAALAGRRGITRSRRRWPILSVVLVAVGAVIAAAGILTERVGEDPGPAGPSVVPFAMFLGGLVVLVAGLVVGTPSFVGLVARAGRWLPLAPRIALRDASRNRTAAAPAISAVMAAVFGSVAVGVALAGSDRQNVDDYRTLNQRGDVAVVTAVGAPTSRDAATAALRTSLPTGRVSNVDRVTCDGTPCDAVARMPVAQECPYRLTLSQRNLNAAEQRAARRDARCAGVGTTYHYFGLVIGPGMTVVVDADAAGAVAHLPVADVDRVAAALRAGAVVVDDPRYVDNGRVTLTLSVDVVDAGPSRTVTAPGFALPHRPGAPITMMTAQTARSLGLNPTPFLTVATSGTVPTVAEEDGLSARLGEGSTVYVERGPQTDNQKLLVLAIVAGIVTLTAAAIATGLAAADGRADLTTLAAVGASPRVRRALSLSQSGVIAGLGSLLGTVAGLGAGAGVLAALNRQAAALWPAPTPYPVTVPWQNVGIALLAVPLIAMLGAGLLTRSRLPIERRP